MPTTLYDALNDYEAVNDSSRMRKTILKSDSHLKNRGAYSKVSKKPQPDIDSCWYREIVRMRGEWLVQNRPQIAQEWLEEKSLVGLAKLAKKYLGSDYKISPRVARMMVYHALEKLAGKQELNGINPDDDFYYRDLNKAYLSAASNGKEAAGSSSLNEENCHASGNGLRRRKIRHSL